MTKMLNKFGDHTLQCTCDECMSQVAAVANSTETSEVIAGILAKDKAHAAAVYGQAFAEAVFPKQAPCDCACCEPCRESATIEARIDFERARAKSVALILDCTHDRNFADLLEDLKQSLNSMALAAPFLKVSKCPS